MTDNELMDRGAQAEQAKPYIASVLDQAKGMILDRLITLAPDQTMLFTVYRSQILYLDDILALVEGDIREGQNAIDRIQGNAPIQKAGIL